jgi:hypothetical protein
MKNNLIWILLGSVIFGLAGFLVSSNPLVYFLTFLPGALLASSFYGGEIPFITYGALISGLIFWAIISWIIYFSLNKFRSNLDYAMLSLIFVIFWPIGVAMGINFSQFAYWTDNISYVLMGIPLISAVAILLGLWRKFRK